MKINIVDNGFKKHSEMLRKIQEESLMAHQAKSTRRGAFHKAGCYLPRSKRSTDKFVRTPFLHCRVVT